MNRYLFQSVAIHLTLLLAVAFAPWLHPKHDVTILDFEYMGSGPGSGEAGGGGGSSGPKAAQMGQPVPVPTKIIIPAKPAPVQREMKGPDTVRIAKTPIPKSTPAKTSTPDETTERGDKTQTEHTNIIRKGVAPGTVAGNGGEGPGEGGGSGGGKGGGRGIDIGPGEGGGGFGYGSYLKVIRQRIWNEWAQSTVFGNKLSCMVGLTIHTDGDVTDIELVKTSENPDYDRMALRAVRNASPLPPLPPDFPKSQQRFNIQFRLEE